MRRAAAESKLNPNDLRLIFPPVTTPSSQPLSRCLPCPRSARLAEDDASA